MLLGFCAISVVLFWLLDSTYKSIQKIYIRRYNEIEQFLNSEKFDQAIKKRSLEGFLTLTMGSNFKVKGIAKYLDIFKIGLMYHNALLYVSMLIIVGLLTLAVK